LSCIARRRKRSITIGRNSPTLVRKDNAAGLKDKYGLSWQIVPTILGEMLNDPDPKKTEQVMKAMLQMKKLDIKGLKQAYEQQ
jgi:predicted 3-demethylubiquinone-9 3-methyltransferase (glyoxalase superfamily)